MIEFIFTTIFVLTIFILGIFAKKILYVNEHELSIEKELNTFNNNFDAIKNNNLANYKLGSRHIY